jgi:perosamine synthetase
MSQLMNRPNSPELDVTAAVEAIRDALGRPSSFTALHTPTIEGSAARDYVLDCVDTAWVSSVGSYVGSFEAMVSEYTGAPYAVATVTGTAALHAALRVAGVEPGDEVLIPALTFVATANAVSYRGAIPHLVDVGYERPTMNPTRLEQRLNQIAERRGGVLLNRETGRRIAALVPMHTFGHPADLDALSELATRWALPLVEDAAESIGSFYKGRHTGLDGRLAILSFNGNKLVTTGGGGMILTPDEALAERARHLTTTAKQPHTWEYHHDAVGYNDRMPNLNAALGCAQMEALPEMLKRKRALADAYRSAVAPVAGLNMLAEPDDATSNHWLNTLVLDEQAAEARDALLSGLNEAGFQSRPVGKPMHHLPMYAHCPRGDLSVTEDLARRLINVPSSAHLAGA